MLDAMSDLAVSGEDVMSIEVNTTSTPLDESLFLLKEYLLTRFAGQKEREKASRASLAPIYPVNTADAYRQDARRNVLINPGIFGLGTSSQDRGQLPGTWRSSLVYPIRLYHSTVILGPLCQPGSGGPCPSCLELRWLAMRSNEEQQALNMLHRLLVYGHNPRLTPFALEEIWVIVESELCQTPLPLSTEERKDQFYTLQLETLQVSRYQLIAHSACPLCATPSEDSSVAAVIELTPRMKREVSEYRIVKPKEYELPLSGYINPVCGMLGGVAFSDFKHSVTSPVTGGFTIKDRFGVRDVLWGGHSNTFSISLRLGLLEGLERYAGHFPRSKMTSIFDSYENLQADALNPLDCGLYQPEFYRENHPNYIAFSPALKMHWVWGYSFRQARPILVPEQLAYYMHYRENAPRLVQDCSNGCAGGNSLEEAILYALLELIERDAFMLTWYAKLAPPRIDAWSCRNRSLLNILDRTVRLGYDIHLFDTRFDVKVPSVTCVAVRSDNGPGKIVLAAGAGFEPEDAIRAALCEVAAYIPSFEDRLNRNMDRAQAMARDYTQVKELDDHPLIYGLPEMAGGVEFIFHNPRFTSVDECYSTWLEERPRNLDLTDDLRYVIDHVLKLGMDVIAVDQSTPEQDRVGLKAASVIVPGFLPIDFGWKQIRAFDLPRLRTVPRTAGFRDTDFEPAMLNLTPHPFP